MIQEQKISYRQQALNELAFNGVGVSGMTFNKCFKQYLNMLRDSGVRITPGEFYQRIINKQEQAFIIFVKHYDTTK